jgi:hypothetical protein
MASFPIYGVCSYRPFTKRKRRQIITDKIFNTNYSAENRIAKMAIPPVT